MGLPILVMALLLSTVAPALADDVLVYQRKDNDLFGADVSADEAAAILTGLGHTVTVVSSLSPALPADLSVFDTIWVPSQPALTGPEQTALRTFVENGGGLYLTGERTCCASLNASVQNLAALLSRYTPIVGAGANEGGDSFTPDPADPFGITTTPNALTEWKTLAAGLIAAGTYPADLAADRFVFSNVAGHGAFAIPPEDLEAGFGCVYIAMDITFWPPVNVPTRQVDLVENIEQFLATCGDTDGDGVSDQGEAAAGTGIGDPDSDDDGLCDGDATVPGTCIAGESPFENYDGDGLIDPLDPDDDNDGLSTSFEVAGELLCPNADGEVSATKFPAWVDPDADNDFVQDRDEGTLNLDGNACPAFVDPDEHVDRCPSSGICPAGFVCEDRGNDGYCQPLGATTTTTTTLPGGSTTTTTTTVPGGGTTTTTLVPGAVEVCGNCLDDDGNGLVDGEDPACCNGSGDALTLKKATIVPRPSGNAKLTLSGTLTLPGFAVVTPTAADVTVQIRAGDDAMLCARIPAARITSKKTKMKFKDRGTVASALGVDRLALAVKKNGTAKLKLRGRETVLETPAAGALRITIGLDGDRCAAAEQSFRAKGRGVRYP